jgi:hypothetical protein
VDRESDLEQLMRYVDEAKHAAGAERVAGEPLADFITRVLVELHAMRSVLYGSAQ